MTKINFRHLAHQHAEAAAAHLKSTNEEFLFTAALRLRMAIECLAYELLQSFKDEVSSRVMETWQPGKLIKELKEIDTAVESDRSISIGVKKDPGQSSEEMFLLGTDKRLTAAWISKCWNALGSYLHEPTINQHRSGKISSSEKMRGRLISVQTEIESVLSATLFATNINIYIEGTCECGFLIKRREELLKKEGHATCAKCGVMWGVNNKQGKWEFFRLLVTYKCPSCEAPNTFPENELLDGAAFTCEKCAEVIIIEKGWCVRLRSSPNT
jgi:hypothetical protein